MILSGTDESFAKDSYGATECKGFITPNPRIIQNIKRGRISGFISVGFCYIHGADVFH